jgi:hypothetical protein
MAWIKVPNGMWKNTQGDDYDPATYMTDAQYQAQFGSLDPEASSLMRDYYTSVDVPTGQTSGDVPVTTRQDTLVAPQPGTSWRQAVEKIMRDNGNIQGVSMIGDLTKKGYFDQFQDFDGAARAELGPWLAARQSEVSDRNDAFGINGFSQDDFWALSVLTAPFTIGASMASSGAAGAEGAAGASGVGAGAAEGVGFYGGIDSAAVGAADYGAGAAAGTTGGGMFDWLDSYDFSGMNEGLEVGQASNAFDAGPFGGFDNAAIEAADLTKFGDLQTLRTGSGNILDIVKAAAPNVLRQLGQRLTGSNGRGVLDQITGDPLGSAFNMTPFLLALAEGNSQKNDIRDITNKLSDLEGEASTANVQSMVLNPYDRETALGREQLLTSLGRRNVLGSSFGNQDLTSFDTTRKMGRGDLATKALMGSIGTRGALLDQVLRGTNTMNTNKNLLLGAGLNASARLFDQPKDPFGLENLLRAQ